MSPSIILHQSTKSISVAYSERELTFEVNLPTNLGELAFKNTSKWVIDHIGVVLLSGSPARAAHPLFCVTALARRGNNSKGVEKTWKPRPGSGLDCRVRALFGRQWYW